MKSIWQIYIAKRLWAFALAAALIDGSGRLHSVRQYFTDDAGQRAGCG